MKEYIAIVIIFIALFTFGCSNKVSTELSNDLLFEKEKIGLLHIENVATPTTKLINKTDINTIINLLQDIKIVKLSKNEEKDILNNGEELLNPENYILTFWENEQDPKPNGQVILLKDKILFIKPDTILTNKRSEMYKTKENMDKELTSILELIKK